VRRSHAALVRPAAPRLYKYCEHCLETRDHTATGATGRRNSFSRCDCPVEGIHRRIDS
jgi:hypothetical protein